MYYLNRRTSKQEEFIETNKRAKTVTVKEVETGKIKAVQQSYFDRWYEPIEEKKTKKKEGKKKMAKKKMTWEELVEKFTAHNDAELERADEEGDSYEPKDLSAIIVISADSFSEELTEEQRKYRVSSANYGFLNGSKRKVISIDSVDGEDPNVGLHTMMKDYGWTVEYAYME